MRIASGLDPRLGPQAAAERVRALEVLGYDTVHLAETIHDPMITAVLAGAATDAITIRTAVVVAFARSPTLLAYQALDAQVASAGRFELGIGSQIRQAIEDRYAMAWSDPVGRLRDHVIALGSLMAAFAAGEPASASTEHIEIDRVPPYFNPGPLEVSAPPILVGAVRTKMTEMAGAFASGIITHPTCSDSGGIDEVVLPGIEAGARSMRRDVSEVRVIASPNVVTGPTVESLGPGLERQRQLIGFLLTTPAYRAVLDRFGVPDLATALRSHLRRNGEVGLGSLVPDDVLAAIVPSAPFEGIAEVLAQRFGGRVDELVVTLPDDVEADIAQGVLADLRSIPTREAT